MLLAFQRLLSGLRSRRSADFRKRSSRDRRHRRRQPVAGICGQENHTEPPQARPCQFEPRYALAADARVPSSSPPVRRSESHRRQLVVIKLVWSAGVIAPVDDGGVGADGPGGAVEDGDGIEVDVVGARPVRALVGADVFAARAGGEKRIAIQKRDR